MDSVLILKTNISVTTVDEVSQLLQIKGSKTIAICNTNTLVRSYKNSSLQSKINAFDVRTPDGFPVAKVSSYFQSKKQERVDGYKVFHETVKKGLENNLGHYFFGSDEETVDRLQSNLINIYPKINILGHTCPPFCNYEDLVSSSLISDIRKKNPDIIWVSLGFPKQEEFINLLMSKEKLESNIVGVGGVFEWVAGTKIKAPEFLANIGLEWIFRLLQEPKRLFKRYFVDNFLFIIYTIRQIFKTKKEL